MPRAAKVCSYVGPEGSCPNLQPCVEHTPKPWQGSNRRAELPKGWDKIRRAVLDRDPVCMRCNSAISTECHHKRHRDDHRLEALEGLCSPCHAQVTVEERQGAR